MCRWSPATLVFLIAFVVTESAWGGAALGTVSPCADRRVEVLDGTASEAEQICRALAEVINYFVAMRFRVDPSISVIVRSRPARGDGAAGTRAHGYFDATGSRIVVVRSREAAPWGVEWGPRMATSFLHHEFAHMAIRRILQTDHARLRLEWHEFIAYAVQFELMDRTLRERGLAEHPDAEAFADLMSVNEFTSRMDPERFAISAYRTYLARGGAGFVEKLLRFEVVPPPMSYPFPGLPGQIPGG